MDKDTLDFYNNNALELFNKYNSVEPQHITKFSKLFNKEDRILDIGAGSGRDLMFLYKKGLNVYGIEPSVKLINIVNGQYPQLKNRILHGELPDYIPVVYKTKKWDGILISAVFQHLNNNELEESVKVIKNLLNKSGYLLISIPINYTVKEKNRDENNRLFNLRKEEYYLDLLETVGITLSSQTKSKDALNRESISWNTLIFRKSV